MGHTHHHHHGRGPRAARSRLERSVWVAVSVCAVLTLVGLVAYWPRGDGPDDPVGLQSAPNSAVVRKVVIGPCSRDEPTGQTCQLIDIDLTGGPYRGQSGQLLYSTDPGNPRFAPGDRIRVDAFTDVNGELRLSFFDFERGRSLLALTVLFMLAVLLLGRLRGLGALGGLAASLLVLTVFVLPSLLRGNDAVAVALVGSSVIAFVALYLAHGVTITTSIALLGTFASLAVIGLLAWLFAELTNLTGLADEYATVLPVLGAEIDLRGMLLAGFVIGSLGVLDDVTVTQVSAVWELHEAQPAAPARVLYRQALNIGRDHIASTVNTLFLAYAGAALPLLLLFTQAHQRFADIATREVVATEVVRSLVGSIGLVASVPITTGLAARVLGAPSPTRRTTTVETVAEPGH